MPKQARQFAIKEIIANRTITSQDQLKRELRTRGISVTQATLSRDLHDLGVIRLTTQSGTRYVLEDQPAPLSQRLITGGEIVSFHRNESLIVIRTLPGHANSVARFIDQQKRSDVLGTIAGDDTIFIAPRSIRATETVLAELKQLLIERS
jgi:transcriptional regulator of arginine metabolism